MRFSTFTAALLVSSAAAWRLPDFDWRNNRHGYGGFRPVRSSTVAPVAPAPTTAAPSVTLATTVVASAAPTTTVVADAVSTKVSTAAGAQATGSSSLTADQQNALDAHNKARADVGTANLVWDASLASDAQTYANTLAAKGVLEHAGVSGQGENLYMQSGSNTPLVNAVNAFLSEKSLYNGEPISATNYMSFGHYTQCVWKSTTKVGMASASGSKGTFVVARYQAPGNMIGQSAY